MFDGSEVIERYFAAFGAGDIEAALECIHPHAVWRVDGDPQVATVGLIQGRDGVRSWLERFPSGFRPLAFSVDRLVGNGADVIALGRFRHRVRPTDAIVDSDYAIRFTVRDELIARYQIFEDSLLIAGARHSDNPARCHSINGTLYGWDDRGSGKPVLFLHGLFLSRQFWQPVIERLGDTRRLVTFDMPGHGVSTWRGGLDLDGIADDLALWIRENGAAPATIVGHSQGGMVALRLAARHPDAVEQLVVVNASARAEYPERLRAWRERRMALLDPAAEQVAFGDAQRMTADPGSPEALLGESTWVRDVTTSHNPMYLASALEAAVLNRGDIRPHLAAITVPVQVISGGLDLATPPELGEEIAALVAHGHHVVVPDAGHHVPTQQPGAVASVLLAE